MSETIESRCSTYLYIRSKRHAINHSFYLIKNKKYAVVERTAQGHQFATKLLFMTDVLEELKIWLNCNGMSMQRMTYDSTNGAKVRNTIMEGVCRAYLLDGGIAD